ncbi:amino acid adenylation domain-containing protein [Streptomyces marincola]|uniref:Amino acid adenylation protein n=1 Tax=Streptomyces marincola TaxID=2878388 RepID=A0A1W7CYQ3_9ACTN|nr:amino acid adenylation domain-containing protein [Streptomyces marincola]ARQ69886.1 amino acid adenylation protein [Streptomyces marincola]
MATAHSHPTDAEIPAGAGDALDTTCLPDLLAEQVRAHPDRVAVVHGDRHLTFRALAGRAGELAARLRHLGVAADDPVGIFAEPSLDLMVSAWGVLYAGGAYLPLSPDYPEERLRYMIEDARVRTVLAPRHLHDRLRALAPQGIRVVAPEDAGAPRAPAPAGPPGPDRLAYVIYTSGSTGRPKGIMIEHRGIVSQMRWLAAAHGLDGTTTVLQKTPMSFDAAQWEILAPACGSRVVMGAPGIHRDPEQLIDTILRHGVTALQCVPTLLQALLDSERFHHCTSLTQVFSGGEVLSKALALQFSGTLPGTALINLYGPTETTVNASAHTVDPLTVADGPQAVPIGTPVDRTAFHILDAARSPVAAGEVGELYISGVQVARGYLNRPELTAERFLTDPRFPGTRLYRTGDLAHWNADGTAQFVGRADNQVKLRGFRVELDEIRLAVEAHDWVKNAAVLVKDDPRTGFQHLIACVELSPKEAALMDQGNHGAHHQSKESRLQVRAQLAGLGTREDADLAGRPAFALPGATATAHQRRRVFARKTYRFYEGGEVTRADLLRLLAPRRAPGAAPRAPETLTADGLGEILRYFGQFRSEERLLPKYGYASPGALYAAQLYIETAGMPFLPDGRHYYHPVHHRLVLIGDRAAPAGGAPRLRVHVAGKRQAIEPVYRNNIREVLEIETGHMAGLFDEVLPAHGLRLGEPLWEPEILRALHCADDDFYLGTFDIGPAAGPRPPDPWDLWVQAHLGRVAGLPAGQYRYRDGDLRHATDEVVRKKDVIAINQQVYEAAGFGITVVSRRRAGWQRYIDLGRALQRLMMNDEGIGLMSSGYSSETGHPLPAAERVNRVLRAAGEEPGPSYFFVGGRVSERQRRSEGMHEDSVHMRGPAEMIRADLTNLLPDYMVPGRVVVMDRLPLTASGKIDVRALETAEAVTSAAADRTFVAPRTRTEERVRDIWERLMKRDGVSVRDDFFATGGNSLIAVGLVGRVNKEFGAALPLQVLFDSPTIERLAAALDRAGSATAPQPASRLVRLHGGDGGPPVFCWPGLGGYTMNLRPLAAGLGGRPFYGVQAHGINPGETPYGTIAEMAEADMAAIRRLQPEGPYTLWGYSFGARVAFETAYRLERAGAEVAHLFLIAPGAPRLDPAPATAPAPPRPEGADPAYADRAFVTILHSVFSGSVTGPALDACLRAAHDDDSFAAFVTGTHPHLDRDLVLRVVAVVRRTYEFTYTFHELASRRIDAPVTIFKARGDDYAFIENSSGYAAAPPTTVDLDADHYSLLREPDVRTLLSAVHARLAAGDAPFAQEAQAAKEEAADKAGETRETRGDIVPHVNIKHFPVPLTEEEQSRLVAAVTTAVQTAFRCDEGVISIALEPVEQEAWNERVYIPEIVNRKALLRKFPQY